MRKTRHDLYLATDVLSLQAMLSRRSIDLDHLVSSRLKEGTDYAILVVGSISEGAGNSESDIDLLVLIDKADSFVPHKGELNLAQSASLETLGYVNGIEINIDFIARDQIQDLVRCFIDIAPALYDPRKMKKLKILGWEDLQFLHRLKNGWVVSGAEKIEAWRDELMVAVLPLYVCVIEYFAAYEFLEDATSALRTDIVSASFMARISAEKAYLSILALNGYTTQSHKWLVRNIHQLSQDSIYPILTGNLDILLPPVPKTKNEATEQIKRTSQLIQIVKQQMCQDPPLMQAVLYLEQQIDYIGIER